MSMYALNPFVKQPLTLHNNCSHNHVMFGPDGADIMVHLSSLTDPQPETNQTLIRTDMVNFLPIFVYEPT